jgi:hypothetical protein
MTDVRRRSLTAILVCAGLMPGLAQAQGREQAPARPDTTALTCAEASALVMRAGAVVMSTGPITYARFVRDVGFCPTPETTRPSWEATRDNPKCFVGYICHDKFNEGPGRD